MSRLMYLKTFKIGEKWSDEKKEWIKKLREIRVGFGDWKVGKNYITRSELKQAIKSKYPEMDRLLWFIDGKENYVKRQTLFNLAVGMKLHKSRHMNKEQKRKVQYELNERIVESI